MADTPVAHNPAEVRSLAASGGSLAELAARESVCRACDRLVRWREQVAASKRRSFQAETYWGRPVPTWGDEQASILILGLAPAAHGGNRTGRIFTGDRSGDVLFAVAVAVRPRGAADLDDGRRRAAADLGPDGGGGTLRAAGQQADTGRARYLRALAGRRARPAAGLPARGRLPRAFRLAGAVAAAGGRGYRPAAAAAGLRARRRGRVAAGPPAPAGR